MSLPIRHFAPIAASTLAIALAAATALLALAAYDADRTPGRRIAKHLQPTSAGTVRSWPRTMRR